MGKMRFWRAAKKTCPGGSPGQVQCNSFRVMSDYRVPASAERLEASALAGAPVKVRDYSGSEAMTLRLSTVTDPPVSSIPRIWTTIWTKLSG